MSTGILGNTVKDDISHKLDASIQSLFVSNYTHTIKDNTICSNIAVCSSRKDFKIHKRGNIIIALEGYLLNENEKGSALLDKLIDLYSTQGVNFPKYLRGSFQIAIFENYALPNQVLYLCSDHNSSRPVFFGQNGCDLFFGPQIQAVSIHIPNKKIFWPSVVQFLIGGYFFSATTPIEQIKLLGPGQYLIFKEDGLEINNYFDYMINVRPENFNYKRTKAILSKTLQKCILESWHDAEMPCILLSGGIDSRYIFCTIAEAVSDTTKLKTATWGSNLSLDKSDGQIANQIAKRYGTQHITLNKNSERIVDEFEEMFFAHSGMTDNVFIHANELNICRNLRERHGIQSLFRGEECFGWHRSVYNNQNALSSLGMSLSDYVNEIDCWFAPEVKDAIIGAFSEYLESELSKCIIAPNALKDTFYHNHRLSMSIQPTNYFKYHFQEIYNPLIDPDVLQIIQNIPDKYRIYKRIFKECLYQNFPEDSKIEIAAFTNLMNWDQEIYNNQELYSFLFKRLNQAPESFSRNFYIAKLEGIKNNFNTDDATSSPKSPYSRIKKFIPNKLKQSLLSYINLRPQTVSVRSSLLSIRVALLSHNFKRLLH